MDSTVFWNQDDVLRAARFAAESHLSQTMILSELPYLLHCAQVAMEAVAAMAADPTLDGTLVLVCAWLHDTAEDTPVTVDQIERSFGPRVAEGVAALTKNPRLPKPEAMVDSLQRLQAQPREVRCVKLADRIVNLQPPPASWKPSRCAGYADEAVLILDSLGDASPALAQRLRSRIREYRPRPVDAASP